MKPRTLVNVGFLVMVCGVVGCVASSSGAFPMAAFLVGLSLAVAGRMME